MLQTCWSCSRLLTPHPCPPTITTPGQGWIKIFHFIKQRVDLIKQQPLVNCCCDVRVLKSSSQILSLIWRESVIMRNPGPDTPDTKTTDAELRGGVPWCGSWPQHCAGHWISEQVFQCFVGVSPERRSRRSSPPMIVQCPSFLSPLHLNISETRKKMKYFRSLRMHRTGGSRKCRDTSSISNNYSIQFRIYGVSFYWQQQPGSAVKRFIDFDCFFVSRW